MICSTHTNDDSPAWARKTTSVVDKQRWRDNRSAKTKVTGRNFFSTHITLENIRLSDSSLESRRLLRVVTKVAVQATVLATPVYVPPEPQGTDDATAVAMRSVTLENNVTHCSITFGKKTIQRFNFPRVATCLASWTRLPG